MGLGMAGTHSLGLEAKDRGAQVQERSGHPENSDSRQLSQEGKLEGCQPGDLELHSWKVLCVFLPPETGRG